MAADKDLRIERLSKHNFGHFELLFCRVFGKKKGEVNLEKKYSNLFSKDDAQYYGFLAFDKDKAVSYCGSILYPFKSEGRDFVGAHSCDHMTLSAYRGRGLFGELTQLQDELLIASNVPFVFGFPNQNNAPILFEKSNWKHLATMHAFEIKLHTIPYFKIKEKLGLSRAIKFKLEPQFSLCNDYIDPDWNGMCRNAAVFDNKNEAKKFVVKTPNGLTWLKFGAVLYIGDFRLNKAAHVKDIVNDWKIIAKRNGAHKIIFLCSDNYPYFEAMNKEYASLKANLVGYKLLDQKFDIDFSLMSFSYMDYDTF